MAFETMRNNLKLLEDNEPISIDALLESIMVLVDDAKEENHSLSAQSFSLSNEDDYIVNLYRLVSFISEEYSANSEVTKQMMASYDKYIEEADREIIKIKDKATEENEIVESKKKRADLLEQERGHLLSLKDENKKLQKKIDELSDPYLDTLDQKNKKLRTDLNLREKREEDIKTDNTTLESKISKIQTSIDSLELKAQKLSKEMREKASTKSKLETSLEEMRSWIEDFDVWFEKVDDEIVNATAQFNAMQNAWNSICLRDDASSFGSESDSMEGQNIISLGEIKEWFETKGKEVEDSLEEYRLRLKTVIETTEKIMKSEN